MVRFEDMVKGKYYIAHYQIDYIMKFDGKYKECYSDTVYLSQEKFQRQGSFRFHNEEINSSSNCYCVREATSEEAQWLESCIKANKFIPFNEVQFNNEIILW